MAVFEFASDDANRGGFANFRPLRSLSPEGKGAESQILRTRPPYARSELVRKLSRIRLAVDLTAQLQRSSQCLLKLRGIVQGMQIFKTERPRKRGWTG